MKVWELKEILNTLTSENSNELEVKIWYDSAVIRCGVNLAEHLVDLEGNDNCFALLAEDVSASEITERNYIIASTLKTEQTDATEIV